MSLCFTLLVILLLGDPSQAQASFWQGACGRLFGHVAEAPVAREALRGESGVTYPTIPMRKNYLRENKVDAYGASSRAPVRYFKDQTRQTLETLVDDKGLLRKADGSLLSTCYPVTADCPAAIFVMDAKGKIYIYDGDYFTENMELIFHSSLAAGKPVASAGEIFVQKGKLVLITDRSGHYRPSPEIFRQVVEELKRRGVEVEENQIQTNSFGQK